MKPISLLVFLFCYLGLQARTKSQNFDLRIHYTIHSDSTCNRIRLKSVLPQSVPGLQDIKDIGFNIEPDSIYFSEADKYALYDFTPSPSRQQLVIRIKGTVYAHDYATCRKQPTAHNEDLSAWLKAENNIERDSPWIRAIAAELKGDTEEETIKNIFYYTQKNFTYTPRDYSIGALGMLFLKRGDCTEYTDLFVALCRASGIPARHTYGVSVQTNNKKGAAHSWGEVYMKDCGWVAFDPTPGNRANFTTLNDMYIQFSQVRNSTELGGKGLFSFWEYWGQSPTINTDYLIRR